jgi:hypothetical protein
MPDASHVGRRYRAAGQVIDAERVRAFAASIAGGAAVPDLGEVPPTFAAVYCLFPTMGQLFFDAEVGLDLTGLVHGEQEFSFDRPVHIGDVVDATAEIVSVEDKRGRVFLTLALEATRAGGGERVCSGRALLIAPGAKS